MPGNSFRMSKRPDMGEHTSIGKINVVGPSDLNCVTLGQDTYCTVRRYMPAFITDMLPRPVLVEEFLDPWPMGLMGPMGPMGPMDPMGP